MNISKTVKGRIYTKLKNLGILDLPEGEWVPIDHEPFMRLSIERHEDEDGNDIIYLSHTYIQEGDLMSDPHIRIMVNSKLEAASAILYQQDGLGIYQQIRGYFMGPDGKEFLGVNQRAEKDCNQFLLTWLDNIKDQGFPIREAIQKVVV